MADDADIAAELVAARVDVGAARAAGPLASGAPGVCGECTYWFPRLVGGLCGFCRDGRLPPDDWEPHPPPESAA